jgi:predicted transport protein
VPIFDITGDRLSAVEQKNFILEKDLQSLIEKNLEEVFNCRFVASEFSTGAQHAGRIDSLALSEEDNPVIIEYKKIESSELINQSLFYLHWIQDHKGDFEIAVQKRLGNGVKVDWSDVRVICIAPNYKKYDLHAVQVMGANIELWKYRLFSNSSLYLEEVFHTSKSTTASTSAFAAESVYKNPVMVEAGKKAALTRATATYTFDERLEGKSEEIKELTAIIREFILGLDESIEEVPKKFYVAYKVSQNIACMEVKGRNIKLFLKLKPSDITSTLPSYRDVTSIGHYGTGDVEFTVSSESEFESVKEFIAMAYNKIGG